MAMGMNTISRPVALSWGRLVRVTVVFRLAAPLLGAAADCRNVTHGSVNGMWLDREA